MGDSRKNLSITKARPRWLWSWSEPESQLDVIPKSRTAQLAAKAKLANIDAERAINRAYQAELARTKAISEAMFKSGKALRFSLLSAGRLVLLFTESARRRFEPDYR